MLPILVLALAASAVAAPGVTNLQLLDANSVRPEGSLLSSFFEIYDSGNALVNGVNLLAVLKDLSMSGGNQASVNGQAVAVIGEAVFGRVGDACASANYVNAYSRYVHGGKAAGVREALAAYIKELNAKIDNIVSYVKNKESTKYSSGLRSGCPNEGRVYQFEAAWDVILGSASSNQLRLVNEEYSVAKRLYCGFSARANNVAASVTAAALPPSAQVFENASALLSNFMKSVSSRSNVAQAAAGLKKALIYGLSTVKL